MSLTGLIAFWHRNLGQIPPGWGLCDGTNGTPDLRDSFVMPAGDSFSPDDSGGSSTHTHGFTGDQHRHNLIGPEPGGYNAGANYDEPTDLAPITGTTDAGANIPPYRALYPIMVL